jgi:hypothetical protein
MKGSLKTIKRIKQQHKKKTTTKVYTRIKQQQQQKNITLLF